VADQRRDRARRGVDRDALEDRLALVVGEPDVLEADVAADRPVAAQVDRARSLGDLALLV